MKSRIIDEIQGVKILVGEALRITRPECSSCIVSQNADRERTRYVPAEASKGIAHSMVTLLINPPPSVTSPLPQANLT